MNTLCIQCLAAGALCVAFGSPCAFATEGRAGRGTEPTVELDDRDGETLVVVRGVARGLEDFLSRARVTPEFWRTLLSVRVAGAAAADVPMLGTHRIDGADLVFEPRFPLRAGLEYVVVYDGSLVGRGESAAGKVVRRVSVPRPADTPRAAVTQVYPTSDELPENQLKFYIHFSAPMSRGESYNHIRLLDDAGEEVENPFLELGEELWNADATRFTLFFDPGRIKRGLKPREDVGPALVEGGSYSLVIADAWRDAQGAPLTGRVVKFFHVTAPDATSPAIKKWELTAPLAGARDALAVRFDEPLDHALASRVIRVHNETGGRVHGTASLSQGETRWEFTPDSAWDAGRYELVAAPELEDLAGNSLARPFETSMDEPRRTAQSDEPRRLPFEISTTVTP